MGGVQGGVSTLHPRGNAQAKTEAGRKAIVAATKKRWGALKRAKAAKTQQAAPKEAVGKKAVAKKTAATSTLAAAKTASQRRATGRIAVLHSDQSF